jgi:hypothetical protein
MRHIALEKTEIIVQGNPEEVLTYRDLIEAALDFAPQGGFSFKDIRERARIQDALNAAENGIMELEDSDYDALERIVKGTKWVSRHKDLLVFLQKFEDGEYKKEKEKK